jgi:hypothetical protein
MWTIRQVARRAAQRNSGTKSGQKGLHTVTGVQNTVSNLVIDKNTRIIYQGLTGRAVSCLEQKVTRTESPLTVSGYQQRKGYDRIWNKRRRGSLPRKRRLRTPRIAGI